MGNRRRVLWWGVGLAVLALVPLEEGALANAGGRCAPLNPAFVRWQAQGSSVMPEKEAMRRKGRVPSPVDLSHVRWRTRGIAAELPVSFDLRTRGGVPPVRDQSAWGTCWAFAALGSLESFLLTSGNVPGADRPGGEGTWDLAERHLAWFGYIDQDGDHVAFTGDTATPDDVYNNGGDDWRAVAILARGTGAVDEDDAPYMGAGWDTPDPSGEEPRRVLLTEALYLPYQDGEFTYPPLHRAIKESVMACGASSIGMFAEFSAPYYNPATFAYHYAGPLRSDHAVCIVGWDDTFPRERFRADNRPAANGAWIVRNSWGSGFGDGGYFYASYASALDSGVSYLGVEELLGAAKESIHDYDPLGWCNTYGFDSSTGWFANVFPLSEDAHLKALSFYVAAEQASYQIRIFSNVSPDASEGFRGTLVAGPLGGSLDMPGYRRVFLSEDVFLPGGTNFAVEVRLTTPGYLFPVPLELPLEGYSDKATALPRQSWVSSDGATWEDLTTELPNANVCLKAFTVRASGPPGTLPCRAHLQGHGAGHHGATLNVRMRPAGGGTVENVVAASDAEGNFLLTPSSGGEWRVAVKERRTLSSVRQGAPGGSLVNFDLLRAGDANDDDQVTIVDFSMLATTFGKSAGGAGYDDRADFNGDGRVTIVDFSLLASNFGKTGDELPAAEAGASGAGTGAPEKPAGSAGASSGETSGCQVAPGLGAVLLALPLGLVFWKP